LFETVWLGGQPPVEKKVIDLGSNKRIKFATDNRFQRELRSVVEKYFQDPRKREWDCPQMYAKTALIFGSFALVYVLLVFAVSTWWQALPLTILLGLIAVAIGLNVQHDGGHHAYSKHDWINRLMSMSLDFLGGSSYYWHTKHGILHHTFVNIPDYDVDTEVGILGRMTPHQKRLPIHKWQHLYFWILYGLLAINWHFISDFKAFFTGRVEKVQVPRPKGTDLVIFFGGKLAFFSMAFAIPMMFHPWWAVILLYLVAAFVLGLTLSMVFQLAHSVEEAEFAVPNQASGDIETPWAIHQVKSTVDFARGDKFLSWLVGGLNFQIEHHLFPKICHINYPGISNRIKETCRKFGLSFHEHRTFWSGLLSHYRFLKRMGSLSTA